MSDSNVSLPATVTIPAGTASLDVPFQISSAFNANHVFAITGQVGTESHGVYGTQAPNAEGTGFIGVLINAPYTTPVIAPAQSINYHLVVVSLGGYFTTIQPTCEGFPIGAVCQFSTNPIPLPPGQILVVPLTMTTGATTPTGPYSPNIVLTDGFVTAKVPIPFNVGDFALSISPSSQTIGATSLATYSLSVNSVDGFSAPIQMSASGLPTGATISYLGGLYPSPQPTNFTIQTQNVAPGSYSFTVLGTSGSVTHTATASLLVAAGDFTGSVSPTTASLSVGHSAQFTATVNSQNGMTGGVSFQCLNLPSGSTCTFSPASPPLPANGSVSDTLTVQVNSRPASAPPVTPSLQPTPWGQPLVLWPLVLALAMFLAAATAVRHRKLRIATSMAFLAVTVALLLASESCGSGGGSSSPPPNPPPPPVSFTITA